MRHLAYAGTSLEAEVAGDPPPVRGYLRASADLIAKCADAIDPSTVERAVAVITDALRAGRPLLVCGNGGSAADAQHIVGELVGRYRRDRAALNVICLTSSAAMITAWSNDVGYDSIFARQVEAYGRPGGALLGLSTSGNSKNVVKAFEQARAGGMTTVGLTGQGGGELAALSDILIAVPSKDTPMIQQAHLCLYHFICEQVEANLS
jgi:D-sedoheptulose 7-phosphate isomerase